MDIYCANYNGKQFSLQFSFIFCNKTEMMPGYMKINFIFWSGK